MSKSIPEIYGSHSIRNVFWYYTYRILLGLRWAYDLLSQFTPYVGISSCIWTAKASSEQKILLCYTFFADAYI